MVEQQEIQKMLLRYQLLESRANALMEKRQIFITRMLEIESTFNSIDEIKKTGGEDILLPIGSSVHVKGSMKKVDKMVVELGAETAIETTVEKAKEILEERKKIMEGGLASLEKEILGINNEIMKLRPEIQAMLKGVKKSSSDVTAD